MCGGERHVRPGRLAMHRMMARDTLLAAMMTSLINRIVVTRVGSMVLDVFLDEDDISDVINDCVPKDRIH
jgi:hypothetical protein